MEILDKALTAFEPQLNRFYCFFADFKPARYSFKLLKWS